jgi:hypothetical protein
MLSPVISTIEWEGDDQNTSRIVAVPTFAALAGMFSWRGFPYLYDTDSQPAHEQWDVSRYPNGLRRQLIASACPSRSSPAAKASRLTCQGRFSKTDPSLKSGRDAHLPALGRIAVEDETAREREFATTLRPIGGPQVRWKM